MTFQEIIEQLKQPVPRELISFKSQGGASIAFVNITDTKDMLDARAPGWSETQTKVEQIGNHLICTVGIVVHGSDSFRTRFGVGYEEINHAAYGDSVTNAYAMAFKRACESFGLARELWRGEVKPNSQSAQKPQSAPQQQTAPQKEYTSTPLSDIKEPKAASIGDLVTSPQIAMIRAIARGADVDADVECQNMTGCKVEELSKKAASSFIDHLKTI